MSDNIIPLRSGKPRKSENFLRLKIRSIETRGTENRGPVFEGFDRLRASKFIRDLVDQVRESKPGLRTADIEERIRSKQVCHAFRLERWTLPRRYPDVTDEALNELRESPHPSKSLRVYLSAIETLADFLGEDPWQLKANLLRQTRHWTASVSESLPIDSERSDNLKLLLETFSSKLAREHDLHLLLDEIAQVPGIWDFHERIFKSHDWYVPDVRCPFNLIEQDETGVSPFPAVPIVRIPYAYVDGPILVGANPSSHPLSNAHIGKQTTDYVEYQARWILYREISLAIGPISHNEYGPLLRTQASISVRFENDVQNEVVILPAHSTCASPHQVYLDGWRFISFPVHLPNWEKRCVSRIRGGLSAFNAQFMAPAEAFDSYPLEEPDRHIENWYFSYTPANADYLNYWFGADNSLGPVRPWSPFYALTYDDRPTWYASGPGRCLELALANGMLKEHMSSEIKRLREAYEHNKKRWRDRLRAQTENLLTSWDTNASQSPETES